MISSFEFNEIPSLYFFLLLNNLKINLPNFFGFLIGAIKPVILCLFTKLTPLNL